MSYSVRPLTSALEHLYTSFWNEHALRQESVLAYHHLAYRDVLLAALGPQVRACYWVVLQHAAGSTDGDRIVAALPCFVKESGIGPTYCSLPFFGPNCGVVCSLSHPDAPVWHRMLLQTALDEGEHAGGWSFTVYTPLGF